MTEFGHYLDWRWVAIYAVVALCVIVWSYATTRRAGWPFRTFLAGLRFTTFSAVLFFWLDLQRVEKISHDQPGSIAVLVDDSRSMGLMDGGKSSRLDVCKDWLRPTLARVPTNVVSRIYGISSTNNAIEGLDSINAIGNSTPLGVGLERVLTDPAADSFSAIVLCSDGIENAGKPATAVARLAKRRGIPIYTLAIGSTNAVRDIAFNGLQVKRTATEEAPVVVTADVTSRGFENRTVSAELRLHNKVVGTKELKLTGIPQTFSMEFVPTEPGFQQYEIVIPPQPGEWLATNNRRVFGVNVVTADLRIIYMEGTPGEWHFLADAVESEGHIKVEGRYPTKDYPKSLEEMLKYDVIINSDIKKEVFTDQQLADTVRWVEEYGGGFAMIGGFSAFGSGGYQKTVIDKLIPVSMEHSANVKWESFKPAFPPGALDHPVMQIGDTPAENEIIWKQKFPPLYGYNYVDHAKPGAIVLAQHPTEQNQFGPMVLLAVQEVGKGRTLAFTSDSTIAWGADFETIWGEPANQSMPLSKNNCDSRYYRRFWLNAVRWLAAGKAAQHRNAVLLQLSKTYCRPDESVTATVDPRLPEGANPKNTTVSLLLMGEGAAAKSVRAKYDSAVGHWVAELHPPAGDFVVVATAMANGKILGDDKQVLVCEAADLEMTEVRAAPELMTRIAEISGGQSLTADDAGRKLLLSTLKPQMPSFVDYRRTPIWARWPYLALVVGLLTVEWVSRRTRGLA